MALTKQQIEAEAQRRTMSFKLGSKKEFIDGANFALSQSSDLLNDVKKLRDELSKTITVLKSVDRNGIAKQIMDGNVLPLLLRHTEELKQIINKHSA